VGLDLILSNARVVIDPTADGSPDSFPNCNFRILFIHSSLPELWGWEAICNFQVTPKPLAISCTTCARKAGPLSDPIDTGFPNQGMISFNRHLPPSWAFSVKCGESFQPSWEGTNQHQKTFASSSSWHFSEIHNQVFKRSSTNTLHLGRCF
jgi:hypothetical protein